MKSWWVAWGPVLAWMVIIFLFSAQSDPFRAFPRDWKQPRVQMDADQQVEERVPVIELVGRNAHVLEYTLLGFLVYRAAWMTGSLRQDGWGVKQVSRVGARGERGRIQGRAPVIRLVAWSVGFCLLYALTDEIHQSFVPFRAFQAGDLVLDSAGALVGALLAAVRMQTKVGEGARV